MTSTTEDTASEPAARRPVHACSARPTIAGDPGEKGGVTTALRREQFRTLDPEAAQRFFAGAYAPGWQITGLAEGSAVAHRRFAARSITVDEVLIQGRARCEIPAADMIVLIQPRTGAMSVSENGNLPPDSPVLVAAGMPCLLKLDGARFDVVSIAADVLHKAAAGGHAPLPQQIRFLDSRPRSRSAIRAWHRALDYATETFASADTALQPLIAGAVAPLLASALLESYPSNLTAEHDLLSDPGVPEALKDAVSFIHRHAAGAVGVNDVAAAVHLTPRAVQYLFRQRLDTTPTEYLRRVRLHRARQDLVAARYSGAPVSEIAARWGFAHTGRFAVLYRQTYGESPHTTLRQ
jgi:AraC-like DNA-binding protein